ncbi:MAG: glycosyltransferase family 4 protein [Armatimonadetes bacterium]|nr:glycosyltransferase family 4 protein [Armatimonadota bacterium]
MIPVLFLQSQSFFGADSALHAMMLRHFDRQEVCAHVAVNPNPQAIVGADAYPHFAGLPDCAIVPMQFGPSINGASPLKKIHQTIAGSGRVPLMLLRLSAYVRKHGIQILHGTEKPRDAFYGTIIGKLSGAKSVVHMHINYGEWQSQATKWSLKHCDAIIGVSEFTAAGIVAAGFAREKVFAVPNCFDAAGAWNPDTDGSLVRREFGIAPDAPVVGIVARLFSWKGHADLVEAIAIVREQLPGVRLLVVGEDDPRAHGGKSFRGELEARIAEIGMGENVIFTGFRTDTPALFAAIDVYAMPTWEEPWGMVFLEAAAMRKPSVAYRSGGVPEVVVDGVTGSLVEPKNIAALAEKITALLCDRILRERMGNAGCERVLRDFAPVRMCHNVVNVYRTVLGVSAPVPETTTTGVAA